jgi:hypothetical protein
VPGKSSRHDQNDEPERDITNQGIYISSHEPRGGGDCELSHEPENDSVSDEEKDVWPSELSRPSPDCEPEGGSVDYVNSESHDSDSSDRGGSVIQIPLHSVSTPTVIGLTSHTGLA